MALECRLGDSAFQNNVTKTKTKKKRERAQFFDQLLKEKKRTKLPRPKNELKGEDSSRSGECMRITGGRELGWLVELDRHFETTTTKTNGLQSFKQKRKREEVVISPPLLAAMRRT